MNWRFLKTKITKKYAIIISGTILLVLLVPLFIAAFFNRPSADDFCQPFYAHKAYLDHGFLAVFPASFNQMIDSYKYWNGVFFSMFLSACPITIFNEKLAIIFPYFFILLLIFSIYTLINVLSKIFSYSKKIVLSATVMIFFMMIALIPSLAEGIFWYSGAINYTFMFSLSLILLASLLQLCFLCSNTSKLRKNISLTLICLLSFLLGGGNFTTSTCLVVIYFFLFLLLLCKRNNFRFLILIPFASFLIGYVVSIKAPGNAIRQTNFTKPTLLISIYNCFKDTYLFVCQYMDLQFIILSLLFLPISFVLVKSIKTNKNFNFPYPFMVSVLSFLLLASGFMPPEYSMGGLGPARLLNIQYFMLVLLYFINMIYYLGWILHLSSSIKFSKISTINIRKLTNIILLFLVLFSPLWLNSHLSFLQTAKELKNGIIQEYAKEFDTNIERIKTTPASVVTVKNFSVTSSIIMPISLAQGNWALNGLQIYYNKDKIIAK